MKSVPKLYKSRQDKLLDKMKEYQNVLHWKENGELMYENKPLSDSHLVDSATRFRNETIRCRTVKHQCNDVSSSRALTAAQFKLGVKTILSLLGLSLCP